MGRLAQSGLQHPAPLGIIIFGEGAQKPVLFKAPQMSLIAARVYKHSLRQKEEKEVNGSTLAGRVGGLEEDFRTKQGQGTKPFSLILAVILD